MKQSVMCILFVFVSLFVVACGGESNGSQGNYDPNDNAIDANAVDSIEFYQQKLKTFEMEIGQLRKDTAALHEQIRLQPNDSVLFDLLRKKEEKLKNSFEKQLKEFRDFVERSKDNIDKKTLLEKVDELLNPNCNYHASTNNQNGVPNDYISKTEVDQLITEAVERAVDSTRKSERARYNRLLNDLEHKIDSIQNLLTISSENNDTLQIFLQDLKAQKELIEIQHLVHSFDIHTKGGFLRKPSMFTIEFYFNNDYFKSSKHITIFFIVRKMLDGVSNEQIICKDDVKTFIDSNNEVKGYTYSQDYMIGKGATEYKITNFINFCNKHEFERCSYTVEAYADINVDGKCELIGTGNVNMK